MGVNSLGFSFGPMVGPVIGGYLLEHASWRTVFYINVPVGLIGLLLAYLVPPYPRRQESRRLDVLGLLSMAMFLVTFLLAMTQGREEGWDSQYIVTLLAIAVVAGVGFVVTELHHGEPFVELRLYKNFAFAMGSLVVFLNTITFMASSFVVTLFLQIHLLYTLAGSLDPHALRRGHWHSECGNWTLSDLFSPKVLVIFGLVTSALCMFQHTTITTVTSLEAITFWFTVRGFTRAFTITPLTTGSLALQESQIRMGSGLLSLNRGIASAVSVALTTTVLQNRLAERMLALPKIRMPCLWRPKNCCTTSSSSSSSWAISPIWRSSKPWPCSKNCSALKLPAQLSRYLYPHRVDICRRHSARLWMGHTTAKPAQTAPPTPQSTVSYTPTTGGENGTTSIVGAEKRKMEWLDHSWPLQIHYDTRLTWWRLVEGRAAGASSPREREARHDTQGIFASRTLDT